MRWLAELVVMFGGKVQPCRPIARCDGLRIEGDVSQAPINIAPLDDGLLSAQFDFFAGGAGRATPQGSYFSLGSGMRSSAAL
jgi:hypothetical protein